MFTAPSLVCAAVVALASVASATSGVPSTKHLRPQGEQLSSLVHAPSLTDDTSAAETGAGSTKSLRAGAAASGDIASRRLGKLGGSVSSTQHIRIYEFI